MSDGNYNLSTWFGLSRASFLVIPRVLMEAMPDEWQGEMAELLNQYDDAFDQSKIAVDYTTVICRYNGRAVKTPNWLVNYRHPERAVIEFIKVKQEQQHD